MPYWKINKSDLVISVVIGLIFTTLLIGSTLAYSAVGNSSSVTFKILLGLSISFPVLILWLIARGCRREERRAIEVLSFLETAGFPVRSEAILEATKVNPRQNLHVFMRVGFVKCEKREPPQEWGGWADLFWSITPEGKKWLEEVRDRMLVKKESADTQA